MSSLRAWLKRLGAIAASYLVAVLASILISMLLVTLSEGLGEGDWSLLAAVDWLSLPVWTLALSASALMVAAPAIFAAERLSLRRWFYFAVMGMIAAIVIDGSLTTSIDGSGLAPVHFIFAAMLGVASGSIYWLLAGRHSGHLRERNPA